MAKKKRQRISYVLPLANTPGGHRLGVNGLAVDHARSILYTGGRDGVICGWDLRQYTDSHSSHAGTVSDAQDAQATVSFRNQVQAHTHWVNDIVLAQDNTALVSASSDVTVKVWRPHDHDASVAQTIGAHSDYVKCLANSDGNANWVASGGLDHKICVWDLNGAGQTLEINVGKAEKVTKGSIYALCARGSVLASGGPESVVRLWDQKSGKCITKLVGHTDNIRDILMSEDGDMLLSASSDQTVKVWSVVAGRCMHTLTMHNESVWCMYSDDPRLSVFYSADRSGLVAKTDVRHAEEFDEGLSVAICQDHEGVSRIIVEGEDIWTASSSSSINRWKDVDTEAEIETPPSSPQRERTQSALSQEIDQDETDDQQHAMTNGVSDNQKIPYTSILRLSVTAPHPAYKASQPQAAYSPPSIRKASEVILEADPGFVIPIRNQPVEVIEGQNGLIKHVMLNDRKRVLTLDTAGEVVLWDLLKCVPIRSYGKQDIENVVPEVNTMESIANWCAVDTRTGKLSVRLEENYCFDAEVYADEIDIPEKIDFREDQRINLGKWVLRNLFTTLLDEEIKRDEEFRKSIRSAADSARSITRNDVPGTLALPVSNLQESLASPDSATTPRATNSLYLATPGLPIGVATPAPQPGQQSSQTSSQLPSMTDEGEQLEKTQTRSSQPPSASSGSHDYFSSKTAPTESDASVDLAKQAATSGMETQPTIAANPTSPLSPEDKDEKKKSGLFGKKFQMNLSKTLGRKSADVKQLTGLASGEEGKSEATSDKSSDKEPEIQTIEDNFFGVVQRIRQEYREQAEAHPDEPLTMGIHASLPIETPVLKQPPHTMVIIQEDNPESGGLADMYRGEICNLGREADLLERIAPMWLGQLLLKNHIPYKDTTKVSFLLHPHHASIPPLPSIASPDGNARLNANRMLRAKKILAYAAERIDPPTGPTVQPSAPPPSTQPQQEEAKATYGSESGPPAAIDSSETRTATSDGRDAQQSPTSPTSPSSPPHQQPPTSPSTPPPAGPTPTTLPPLKPEDYLDLYCQDRLVPINMTLATLRVHVWRTGGDVVLYYKAKEDVWRRLREGKPVSGSVGRSSTTK